MHHHDGESPATLTLDDCQEFDRLFWLVRREHAHRRREPTPDEGPVHQSLVQFALDHRILCCGKLLQASWLERTKRYQSALDTLISDPEQTPNELLGIERFLRAVCLIPLKNFDEAIALHCDAIADPMFFSKGHALNSVGNAYLAKKNYQAAVEAYEKAEADSTSDARGGASYNLGNLHASQKALSKAIEAYKRALDDSAFDARGYAWNSLGNVYAADMQYDEAIKSYREALAETTFDVPGYAWNNLGNVLAEKGLHDDAIVAFQNALGDPHFDTRGEAWNNLGLVHAAKRNFNKAIEAYESALNEPGYDAVSKTLTNLGVTFYLAERYVQAREMFNTVVSRGDDADEDEWPRQAAQAYLDLLDTKLGPSQVSAADFASLKARLLENDSVERRISMKIDAAGEDQYRKYMSRPASERNNILSVLRGWSSAVTLLEGKDGRWFGGGYFLKWNGHGIVIDPGFDFLRNFHDAGFHAREIHAVLVTHSHPDHNADLTNIDDLRYEVFKRGISKDGTVDRNARRRFTLIWDDDSRKNTLFSVPEAGHRELDILFDRGRCGEGISTIERPHQLPITVSYFRVHHGDDVRGAVGIKVALLDDEGTPQCTIGYTGDTQHFSALCQHLSECDVLIAHMSQPDPQELVDVTWRKKRHLGYWGLIDLLNGIPQKPKLTLVGEFWAGLTDLRIDLVNGVREHCDDHVVLPAGLGLQLAVPDFKIKCNTCPNVVPFDEIRVAPSSSPYGDLLYICARCMMK